MRFLLVAASGAMTASALQWAALGALTWKLALILALYFLVPAPIGFALAFFV